jgi:hypothetical protein
VPRLRRDRVLAPDIETARDAVEREVLREAAEGVVGALA